MMCDCDGGGSGLGRVWTEWMNAVEQGCEDDELKWNGRVEERVDDNGYA